MVGIAKLVCAQDVRVKLSCAINTVFVISMLSKNHKEESKERRRGKKKNFFHRLFFIQQNFYNFHTSEVVGREDDDGVIGW